MICLKSRRNVKLDLWWVKAIINDLMYAGDLVVLSPYIMLAYSNCSESAGATVCNMKLNLTLKRTQI